MSNNKVYGLVGGCATQRTITQTAPWGQRGVLIGSLLTILSAVIGGKIIVQNDNSIRFGQVTPPLSLHKNGRVRPLDIFINMWFENKNIII